MPTLPEFRAAADAAQAAYREARDVLGRARDRTRNALAALHELQRDAIDWDVDPATIAAARAEFTAANTALTDLERDLRPERTPRDRPLPPASGS